MSPIWTARATSTSAYSASSASCTTAACARWACRAARCCCCSATAAPTNRPRAGRRHPAASWQRRTASLLRHPARRARRVGGASAPREHRGGEPHPLGARRHQPVFPRSRRQFAGGRNAGALAQSLNDRTVVAAGGPDRGRAAVAAGAGHRGTALDHARAGRNGPPRRRNRDLRDKLSGAGDRQGAWPVDRPRRRGAGRRLPDGWPPVSFRWTRHIRRSISAPSRCCSA